MGDIRKHLAFFTRRDRDFWHLYFCAPDLATLRQEVTALPSLRTEPVAIDLVGGGTNLEDLVGAVEAAGFRRYAQLLRLARSSQPGRVQSSSENAEVVWAEQADRQAIMDLLECSFDRYADQLPMPYEIEAAISARQIQVVRCKEVVAALLFFETQGLTSTIRYWVVAERFRSHRFGSALMHQYFAAQSAVRRFLLWVTADNENAVLKYRHYGYNPDGLIDHVLVNEMIPR